ncbi:DNA-damage-inducible protein D [Hyphomicrobium denitrificans ATCC 51888]|uniref:DNA-damage-inducible protein D n=1 Tax=Hyphomicrobium denitrificans (strain ATCC 51888 / DSM 1869 / NCIMB 11706 / TK 0415) TaxID=582899 RepID=D8JZ99_HYPDA|nr:BRO family protein [Hyphomicrobium denitrificans]ADJ23701.1 DNA-damage-inducible protein D [Hyphomicrobium denitrificans ATCC 51888]
MSNDLTMQPAYQATMERLEQAKRISPKGVPYWLAREIMPIMGYQSWRNFEKTLGRAKEAFGAIHEDADKHFVETDTMLLIGGGAERSGKDYFLSRPAAYLIAMNGDPAKPEIAAAQAYFAVQTRRMEIEDARTKDEKRLEGREKATVAFKKVSSVAKKAGVANTHQPFFHDARYQGIYRATSAAAVREAKGIPDGANPFNYFGALELSMHEFQMNLAADVIAREGIKDETTAIQRNLDVARHVRSTIDAAGGTDPMKIEIAEPIDEVKKRLAPPKPPKATKAKKPKSGKAA